MACSVTHVYINRRAANRLHGYGHGNNTAGTNIYYLGKSAMCMVESALMIFANACSPPCKQMKLGVHMKGAAMSEQFGDIFARHQVTYIMVFVCLTNRWLHSIVRMLIRSSDELLIVAIKFNLQDGVESRGSQ